MDTVCQRRKCIVCGALRPKTEMYPFTKRGPQLPLWLSSLFPKGNKPEATKIRMRVIRSLKPTLCGEHFSPSCFDDNQNLIAGAVPTMTMLHTTPSVMSLLSKTKAHLESVLPGDFVPREDVWRDVESGKPPTVAALSVQPEQAAEVRKRINPRDPKPVVGSPLIPIVITEKTKAVRLPKYLVPPGERALPGGLVKKEVVGNGVKQEEPDEDFATLETRHEMLLVAKPKGSPGPPRKNPIAEKEVVQREPVTTRFGRQVKRKSAEAPGEQERKIWTKKKRGGEGGSSVGRAKREYRRGISKPWHQQLQPHELPFIELPSPTVPVVEKTPIRREEVVMAAAAAPAAPPPVAVLLMAEPIVKQEEEEEDVKPHLDELINLFAADENGIGFEEIGAAADEEGYKYAFGQRPVVKKEEEPMEPEAPLGLLQDTINVYDSASYGQGMEQEWMEEEMEMPQPQMRYIFHDHSYAA